MRNVNRSIFLSVYLIICKSNMCFYICIYHEEWAKRERECVSTIHSGHGKKTNTGLWGFRGRHSFVSHAFPFSCFSYLPCFFAVHYEACSNHMEYRDKCHFLTQEIHSRFKKIERYLFQIQKFPLAMKILHMYKMIKKKKNS